MTTTRSCETCGASYRVRHKNQRYCKMKCRPRRQRVTVDRRHRTRPPRWDVLTLVADGYAVPVIAEVIGVTPTRVYQILRREREKGNLA